MEKLGKEILLDDEKMIHLLNLGSVMHPINRTVIIKLHKK